MNRLIRGMGRIKRYLFGIWAVTLILVNITPIYGKTVLTKEKAESYLYDIAYYEQLNITDPSYGSIAGEWAVMGLARYGAVTDQFLSTYKSNLKKHLKSCNGVLSENKYTEYARVVIALTSIEENPEKFGGYNVLRPLAEYDKITKQGINGVIYALIALDCGNYDIPEPVNSYDGSRTTREKLIGTILENQKSDGGWNFGGTKSDTDMTAMAIQALAPYYNKEDKVKKAVNEALEKLGELQQKDGSFCSGTTKNCESTAQVLTALSVMNISVTDNRFVKNNNTVIDGMMLYYKGGGFSHLPGWDVNQMATEQAMYALTAYYRKVSGMNGLFEMKDGITRKDIKITHSNKSENMNEESKKEKSTVKKKKKVNKKKEKNPESTQGVINHTQEETAVHNEKTKKNGTEKKTQTETKTKQKTEGAVIETNGAGETVTEILDKNKNKSRKPPIGIAIVFCGFALVMGFYVYKKVKTDYSEKGKE